MGRMRILWWKAERENRLSINHNDLMLIIISSAVSGAVSFLLSHANPDQFRITGNQFVDVTIYALIMAVVVAIVVSLLFRILGFLSRVANFLDLMRRYYFNR